MNIDYTDMIVLSHIEGPLIAQGWDHLPNVDHLPLFS